MTLVNVVLAQGGGPTSVINGSLAAAIAEYQKHKGDKIGKICVALHGADGLLKEELIDVTDMSSTQIANLEQTICASAGSSRAKLDTDEQRSRVIDVLEAHGIGVLNLIGGGDTASTVAEINKTANSRGYHLISEHIMKTVDNDGYGLFSPGWGTTGVWQRDATLSLIAEVDAMPGVALGVSMGRDSGWITAMTTHAFLAEGKDKRGMQVIYTPETGFDLNRFTDECIEAYINSRGRLVVNVSEGVQEDGCDVSLHERLVAEEASNRAVLSDLLGRREIVELAAKISSDPEWNANFMRLVQDYAGVEAAGVQRDQHGQVAYGEIRSINLADWLAAYLQATMKEKLGKKLRVRGNTFGYMQRCPPNTISSLDLHGAKLVGQEAARFAVERISGGGNSQVNDTYGASIVLIDRVSDPSAISERMEALAVDLGQIANLETGKGIQYKMPEEFMTRGGPTDAFLAYSEPLVRCEILRADPRRFLKLTDPDVEKIEKKLPAYESS